VCVCVCVCVRVCACVCVCVCVCITFAWPSDSIVARHSPFIRRRKGSRQAAKMTREVRVELGRKVGCILDLTRTRQARLRKAYAVSLALRLGIRIRD